MAVASRGNAQPVSEVDLRTNESAAENILADRISAHPAWRRRKIGSGWTPTTLMAGTGGRSAHAADAETLSDLPGPPADQRRGVHPDPILRRRQASGRYGSARMFSAASGSS